MSFDDVILELSPMFTEDSRSLTNDDLQRWSAMLNLPPEKVIDMIAAYLAQGFNSGKLSFEFCDYIVNALFGIITGHLDEAPAFFWKVYLAFDEGEWPHPEGSEDDPVELYTRPMIAKIIGEISD